MYLNPSWEYLNLLKSHHRVKTEVYILDNSRRYLADATSRLVSGVVDMDADADVSRSGKMVLLDQGNSLGLDFGGEAYGAHQYNRMVQIIYRVTSFDGSQSFAVPIFTGPVKYAYRDGPVINVEFVGMEHLAQYGMLNAHTWNPWPKSAIIMNALTIYAGENFFRDYSGGTQIIWSWWSVETGDNLWIRLKELADSMGMKLYYDGEGICNIKPKTTGSVFTADSSWLTGTPEEGFDIDRIKNVVKVEGASAPVPNSEEKVKMTYEAWPSPQHPYSPQSLARNGWPRVMPHIISDDSLTQWGDLSDAAWQNLAWDLMMSAEVTATMAVVPFLEEHDVITIRHPKLIGDFVLNKWSIPLVGDAEMSVNFFSTTSMGDTSKSNAVTNAKVFGGRWQQPGVKHGPSGATNSLAEKWRDKQAQKARKRRKKNKKKNRNKKGGK